MPPKPWEVITAASIEGMTAVMKFWDTFEKIQSKKYFRNNPLSDNLKRPTEVGLTDQFTAAVAIALEHTAHVHPTEDLISSNRSTIKQI